MNASIPAIVAAYLIEFVNCIFIFLSAAAILHCFYDDTVTITKKRAAIGIGGIILLPYLLVPVIAIAGFIIGVRAGIKYGDDAPELAPSSTFFDIYLSVIQILIYIWTPTIIGYRKGDGFKRNSRRILSAAFLMIVMYTACTLLTEMARYCISETGMFNMHYIDFTVKDDIIQNSSISVILAAVTLLLYFRIYKKDIVLRMRKVDYLAVLLYGGIETMLYILFKVIEEKGISLAGGNFVLRFILIVIMALLILVTPVLIIRSRISAAYQERTAYQENFLETELNASRQYKAAQEDTRAFRHDVQNNLTVLAMLMQEGKTEEAKQYLSDMRTEVSALSPKVVTGDDMVDSLISAKLPKMEELGITFKTDGVIDGGLNWKPMDICTLFANLLDNAIEAAAQTENGFITIEFRKSDHHRLIRASNSCAADIDCAALMSGGHITEKQDKSLHGYGISNIRRTLEKYGGMMKFSCTDRVFTAEIILQK